MYYKWKTCKAPRIEPFLCLKFLLNFELSLEKQHLAAPIRNANFSCPNFTQGDQVTSPGTHN